MATADGLDDERALAPTGCLLSPALGALLMSLSTAVVAVDARLLRRGRWSGTVEERVPAKPSVARSEHSAPPFGGGSLSRTSLSDQLAGAV
ncbi:MAG: hypothetical protein PVH41_03100 [Anaerolineae bacterium]|jgi:hypothetical protein